MEETQDTTKNVVAKNSKAHKAVLIVLDVILYLFLAFSVFVLVLSLISNKKDGAGQLFGFEMRLVVSDSMQKSEYSADVSQYKIGEIKVRSMVFIERAPDAEEVESLNDWCSSLETGDVLTFAYVTAVTQDVITHRIVEILPTENGYKITLQGDNRANEDSTVSQQVIFTSPDDYEKNNDRFNYIIGKVVGQSAFLGNIIYGVRQPVGVALIVILPCSLIMIWQIARIIGVVNEDKKRKAAERALLAERTAAEQRQQSEQQAAELEDLKRKIAELEKNRQNESGDKDEPV